MYSTVKCLVSSWSSQEAHIMCTMWNLDICHVYTVKLFHSCCQLHLQDRVQTNKVFHIRPVFTVHWLFCRSVIGSLSPTYIGGKSAGVSSNYSRPRGFKGQMTGSYFHYLHYIKVNQLSFCSHRKLHVFMFFLILERIQVRKAFTLCHAAVS